MKFHATLQLMSFALFAFTLPNLSSSTSISRLVQRQDASATPAVGQDVADIFQQIEDTIVELQEAQASAPQSGTPDFSKSAQGLASLAMMAEQADTQLTQLGDGTFLDEEPSHEIRKSLNGSATSVVSITDMVVQGKPWFDANNATDKIVSILQLNAYQFTQLFTDLNLHRADQYAKAYSKSEGLFLCSIVNAIAALDSTQAPQEAVDTCAAAQPEGYSNFDPSAFQNLFVVPPSTPSGFSRCFSSATTFLQSAYSQQTLGTKNVACKSVKLQANTFYVPENALLL